jgi:hypothetical protein
VEFRLRNVRAGVALSVASAVSLTLYCLSTWSHPHRGAILAICVVSGSASLFIERLPSCGCCARRAAARRSS